MSDYVYVVSKQNGNVVKAIAFAFNDPDANNQALAEDYLKDVTVSVPWQDHSIMTVGEYVAATDPEATDPEPDPSEAADPVVSSSTPADPSLV